MIYFPNSKINIGLNVIEKRSDGFHNIETLFYPIPLNDILEIRENNKDIIRINISGIKINEDVENNLCIKAYNILKKDFPNLPKVDISLHKSIPLGAGLGGGSSDAAYTLKLLNYIFSLGLNDNKLIYYSRILGADCAFFLKNKPIYAFNKGDEFENTDLDLSGKYLLLIKPDVFISTREAYSKIIPSNQNYDIRKIINDYPIKEWKNYLKNDFEISYNKKYPIFSEIKNTLYDFGAEFSSLSGSGSIMYGIFSEKINNDIIKSIDYPFVKLIRL